MDLASCAHWPGSSCEPLEPNLQYKIEFPWCRDNSFDGSRIILNLSGLSSILVEEIRAESILH